MRKKLLLMMAAILTLVVASGLGLASDVGVPTVAIDDSPQDPTASVDPLVTPGKVTTILYDDFSQDLPVGVYVPDPNGKWFMPYGMLEAGINDANHYRRVTDGAEHMSALPFTLGADFSVYDHLKLMEVSNVSFPLPPKGSIEFSADIIASTPGTVNNLWQEGIFGPSGTWTDPLNPPTIPDYSTRLLDGQQAGVVLNMIDFCTGQLFDWFLTSDTAFTLIERLPSNVTNNTVNCPGAAYVGMDKMYTQIADQVPLTPGKHTVSIRVTQNNTNFFVQYFLDGRLVTKISNIGVPLDRQGVRYTGIYPSLGPGENLKGQIQSFSIGHGLFSLLDAFPFQHPEAPGLSVSIPVGTGNPADAGKARLFGQGAKGIYDNFRVTIQGY